MDGMKISFYICSTNCGVCDFADGVERGGASVFCICNDTVYNRHDVVWYKYAKPITEGAIKESIRIALHPTPEECGALSRKKKIDKIMLE